MLDWAKGREVSTGGASDVTEHVQSFVNSGSIIFKTNNKQGNPKNGVRNGKRKRSRTKTRILCIRFFLQRTLQWNKWVVQFLFIDYFVGLKLYFQVFLLFEILLFRVRTLSTFVERIVFCWYWAIGKGPFCISLVLFSKKNEVSWVFWVAILQSRMKCKQLIFWLSIACPSKW